MKKAEYVVKVENDNEAEAVFDKIDLFLLELVQQHQGVHVDA